MIERSEREKYTALPASLAITGIENGEVGRWRIIQSARKREHTPGLVQRALCKQSENFSS